MHSRYEKNVCKIAKTEDFSKYNKKQILEMLIRTLRIYLAVEKGEDKVSTETRVALQEIIKKLSNVVIHSFS